MSDPNMYEAAAWWIRRGHRVFPLIPNGAKPIRGATAGDAVGPGPQADAWLRSWFTRSSTSKLDVCNIGIAGYTVHMNLEHPALQYRITDGTDTWGWLPSTFTDWCVAPPSVVDGIRFRIAT